MIEGTQVPYVLRCFPHDDEAFAAHAARSLATVNGQVPSETDGVPEEMVAALRAAYPNVAVHRSHELATIGREDRTLYAYRDGGPIAS
ncbi:MAG TPA: hypothetical protein VFI34_06425 [Candidatus Limnocylindrales bacterium]|nr:hypothetical protein [Candidatus Limnocylindrales bacterium]